MRLPEGWKEVELGEVCELLTGFAFKSDLFNVSGNGMPLIRIRDLAESKTETFYSGKYDPEFIVKKEDILIGMDGEFKVFEWKNQDALLNQRVCKLIPNKSLILPKYIYYIIGKKLKEIEDVTPFVTVKHISSKKIMTINLLLPLLQTQQKIVAILEKAEQAKEWRKEADKLTEEFLKSVFLEMFGDPETNPKKWPIGKLSDLTKKTQYGSSKKAHDKGKYLILRMNNITYEGGWNFASLKYLDLDEKEKDKYLVYAGELLFNRTNSKELVGKTAVYRKKEPVAFAGYLIKWLPNEKANSEFVAAYLNSSHGKATLLNMAKSIVGMANINAEELKNISIYQPPKYVQDEFASIVKEVESMKEQQKHSKEQIDRLFNALMQKAFKGGLAI